MPMQTLNASFFRRCKSFKNAQDPGHVWPMVLSCLLQVTPARERQGFNNRIPGSFGIVFMVDSSRDNGTFFWAATDDPDPDLKPGEACPP